MLHFFEGGFIHYMASKKFVVLTLTFRQENNLWVGQCKELGTSTFGRSLQRTHDELLELSAEHLKTLEQLGERAHFFKKHGIPLYTQTPPAEIQQTIPVDEETYVHAHRISLPA